MHTAAQCTCQASLKEFKGRQLDLHVNGHKLHECSFCGVRRLASSLQTRQEFGNKGRTGVKTIRNQTEYQDLSGCTHFRSHNRHNVDGWLLQSKWPKQMQSLHLLWMVGGASPGPTNGSFCSCDGKHRCSGHVISVLLPLAAALPHPGAPLSYCRLQHTLQLTLARYGISDCE